MIRIISDSTCDLSQELIEKHEIQILPLSINLGDMSYLDGVEIQPDEIFKWVDAHSMTPKTSACSVEAAVALFKPLIDADNELICFAVSEKMSGSANVMRMAAKELRAQQKIKVIDSANLSSGIGLMILRAAELIKIGWSADQIAAEMERIKPLIRSSFVVDKLTYLHRGGRCSGLAALAGSTLKIHPKIVVENGAMHADKKYRGKMSRVIEKYVEDQREQMLCADSRRIFITHSGCNADIVENLRQMLTELHYFDEVLVTRAGGVISSHCGPGTLGVLYIAQKRER